MHKLFGHKKSGFSINGLIENYPNIFKDKLGQINPLFQGAMPNDAKDLLTFLLMQLHEELNNPDNNNRKKNVMVNQEMQQNKEAMLRVLRADEQCL